MYIITIGSLKGGVGKTTLAVNLSLQLSAKGKRVLAIDMDVNNNLTDFFLRRLSSTSGESSNIDEANVYHVLLDLVGIEESVYPSGFGVDVIPATVGLKSLAVDCGGDFLSLLSFEEKVKRLDYDFVVIDTPPYPVAELKLAMSVSDLVLCPVVPRRWSFQGSDTLSCELEELRDMGIPVPGCVLVPSLIGSGKKEVARLSYLEDSFSLSKTRIRRLAAIETAGEDSRPLKKNTKAYIIFEELCDEVLSWKK